MLPLDPNLANAAAGVIGGAIGQSARDFAKRKIEAIKLGKLAAFDPDTARSLLSDKGSAEYVGYAPFVLSADHEHAILIGRRLRAVAAKGDRDHVDRIRQTTIRIYDPRTLRLAEAVQADILDTILSAIKKYSSTPVEYVTRGQSVFENIDNYVLFVEEFDSPELEAHQVLAHLRKQKPPIFAIAGSGNAIPVADRVATDVTNGTADYDLTRTKAEYKLNCFLRLVGRGPKATSSP